MRLLAIDSATEACSVALFEQGELVAGECRMLGRGHAEQLVPMIEALPGCGEAERIAVSLGPGSFTGLRVGLAAARALALAWGAQLVGYPTLALVAAMARALHGPVPLSVAMNGGHGEWFMGRFGTDGAPDAPVCSLAPEAACAWTSDALIAGSRAEDLVRLRGTGRAQPLWPDARQILLLDPGQFEADPVLRYGRAPDARIAGSAA